MAWMANLPVDLVLVRHGESEGNLYQKMEPSEARDRLHGRHTNQYRLTDLGRAQAVRAGKIVQEQVGSFDLMFCSEWVRAVETAAHMNLPNSRYETETLIREIDNGKVKGIESPLKEFDSASLAAAGKWWHRPIGGESFADLCLRLLFFLEVLRDKAAGLRVLVVCHGHVIRAFRTLLEDLTADEFGAVLQAPNPNCQVRWYTRRDGAARIHSRMHKVICIDMEVPEEIGRSDAACFRMERMIKRERYSIAQLRARVEAVPQLLNNSDVAAGSAAKREGAAG